MLCIILRRVLKLTFVFRIGFQYISLYGWYVVLVLVCAVIVWARVGPQVRSWWRKKKEREEELNFGESANMSEGNNIVRKGGRGSKGEREERKDGELKSGGERVKGVITRERRGET